MQDEALIRRLALLLVLVGVFLLRADAPAQDGVTDAVLRAAGGERSIRIGSLTTGASQAWALEVYVSRVLAGEGEPNAPEAARQALAIAIRTYALANGGRHRRDGYDLCDTTHCQVLRASTPASRKAALDTAGQVLLFEGRPAELFYSASCGGSSEDASDVWPGAAYPYLRARPDDVHDGDTDWALDLSYAELTRSLQRAGFSGELRGLEIARRSGSGRAALLRLTGMDPATIPGDQLRGAVGATRLRSTAFALTVREEGVRFTGRGYGHGVGMCVIGAGRRAARGETAAAILAQYYPGLDLVRLAGGAGAPPMRATPAAPDTTVASAAAPRSVTSPPVLPVVSPSGVARVPGPATATAPVSVPMSPPSAPGPAHLVTVSVPRFGTIEGEELTRQADRAAAEIATRAGVAPIPLAVELHPTLDSYRLATGRPWWIGYAVVGDTIHLAPAAAQGGTLESALRVGIAERLVRTGAAGQPLWVRTGAARYFATGVRVPVPPRLSCPRDAELMTAATAAAQREAEQRATACVVRGLDRGRDWRELR